MREPHCICSFRTRDFLVLLRLQMLHRRPHSERYQYENPLLKAGSGESSILPIIFPAVSIAPTSIIHCCTRLQKRVEYLLGYNNPPHFPQQNSTICARCCSTLGEAIASNEGFRNSCRQNLTHNLSKSSNFSASILYSFTNIILSINY